MSHNDYKFVSSDGAFIRQFPAGRNDKVKFYPFLIDRGLDTECFLLAEDAQGAKSQCQSGGLNIRTVEALPFRARGHGGEVFPGYKEPLFTKVITGGYKATVSADGAVIGGVLVSRKELDSLSKVCLECGSE